MTTAEWDRLICPRCGEQNRPGAKPLLERVGHVVVCAVCGTVWAPALFMPWLTEEHRQ